MVDRTHSTRLRSGEKLLIKRHLPPLGEYAPQVGCWQLVRDDLLGGSFVDLLYTPYWIGEIGGMVVGYMSYYTPRNTRDVGVVEFVQTDENHRRKGIADALMGTMIEHFLDQNGKALYLCTANPHAGTLYERHGFDYFVGDGMRYLAPDATTYDQDSFNYGGPARIREAHWGDLPRASALFNHPQPSWLVKDYLTHAFRDTRYERHFVELMRRSENGKGAILAMESPRQTVVGLAAFERMASYSEQHVATLSFRIVPAYSAATADLFSATMRCAESLGIGKLQVYAAACDGDQIEILEENQFTEETRLRDHLRNGSRFLDLVIMTRALNSNPAPTFAPSYYYGCRQPWQEERLRSGKH